MSMDDLTNINIVSTDSIEKLGELSVIYVRNNNSKTKLNYIYERHLELIAKIIKFNNIFNEISQNIKQLASLNLSEEEKRYTYIDIFFRYKLQLFEIIADIKVLIVHNTII